MRSSAPELTARLGGELVGPDVGIVGASIDSRTIRPGQRCARIVAERDGHAFISGALKAGAAAYLTAQEPVARRVGDIQRLAEVARPDVGIVAMAHVEYLGDVDGVARAKGELVATSPWRTEVHQVPGGPVLVVDCFNAIPASVVRSLTALPDERKQVEPCRT